MCVGFSAACELIARLIPALGAEITPKIADCLYTGISTDTGCFRTRGTTARCMEVAARLRETGFDAFALTHRLFDVKSPARLRLEAAIYGAMRYPEPDTAAVIVTKEMLARCGVREDDLDKISILTTAAEGVKVGLMLRELPDGMTVALENVMEPEPSLLAEIARQVDDARLGLCLDVGHANTFVSHVPPLEWIAPMAPWLRHVHLHNNAGRNDLHDPLGQGTLAMEQVLDTVLALCPAATFTLENQDCGPSLDWLRQHGYGANT